MEKITYIPTGVCSSRINIDIDDGIIKNVEFVGGCPGNTVGISKLCVGRNVEEVLKILSGIDCRGRGTSCPDQLARALKSITIGSK